MVTVFRISTYCKFQLRLWQNVTEELQKSNLENATNEKHKVSSIFLSLINFSVV